MFENLNINALNKREKLAFYARINDNYINMEAIFSDTTSNFISPLEPTDKEPVYVKIRTARDNVDAVYIVSNKDRIKLNVTSCSEKFDYYEGKFNRVPKKVKYHFEIEKGKSKYYYTKSGLSNILNESQCFVIIPNWKTPDWAKSCVMYHIYVDRFNNGDKTNDVVKNEYKYLGHGVKKCEWEKPVEARDVPNHYGGDIQGIIDKLPYLKDLGVEVLYLSPLFVSPSNHKYDIQDYDYIDPHFGKIVKDEGKTLHFEQFRNEFATKYMSRTTDIENLEASNKLFADFTKKAHDMGIRIIIDGVFNHCGAFNKWMDREKFYEKNGYETGAYNSKDSKYHDFFKWGNVSDSAWPNNTSYSSWWGHDNHPKLNFEGSKDLEKYILRIAKKWIEPPYNVDGWRLDVGADLGHSEEYNHKFWKKFRKAVKDSNEETIIISEHYGDPSAWLQGDEWDTVMNYDAFMEPITWFLTGMEKHSEGYEPGLLNNADAFEAAMRYNMGRLSNQAVITAMNQLSNHDHSRFLTRTNQMMGRLHTTGRDLADKNVRMEVFYEAIVMQMTWPGSPTLYYGDEAGVTGWTDPDNRRTFPWGNENKTLLKFYKEAIRIHKENSALIDGSILKLATQYGVLVYGRWNEENSIIVCINNNDEDVDILIPVWTVVQRDNGVLEALLESDISSYKIGENEYQYENGYINLTLTRRSSKILREKKIIQEKK